MEASCSSRYRRAVLVMVAVINLFPCWTHAETTSAPSTRWRQPQYHGLQRTGTMVALILGCVIVPLGLVGFLILLVNKCYSYWKQSRQEKIGQPPVADKPRRPPSAESASRL